MEVTITESKKLKQASAREREGRIEIRLPAFWPKSTKQRAISSLSTKIKASLEKQSKLIEQSHQALEKEGDSAWLDFQSLKELESYIHQLNKETFQSPLKSVKIGRSKYSYLAQVHLRTGVMTVSKYCLSKVPKAAFRYLILHELAHFFEASHNRRFWSLVARFCPDYKYQRQVISAFHQQAVKQDDKKTFVKEEKAVTPVESKKQEWSHFFEQLLFKL